ncbi:MAG: hypothetical protein V3T20_06640 [Gemmatimonadota bacterium]
MMKILCGTKRPWLDGAVGIVLLAGTLSACNLEVFDPDIVTPEDVSDPASLPIAIAGVVGDFQLMFDTNARYTGLLTDEFILAGTFPTRLQVDTRDMLFDNSTLTGVYENIHVARFSADNLVQAALGLVGDPDADQDLVAQAIAVGQFYGAYVRLALAEMYCQSILGGGDETNPNYESSPKGPDERMQDALTRFQAAEASATAFGDADLADAARIGQARANMWLGNYAAAASAVASVSTGFEFMAAFSSNDPSQYNDVYTFTYADTQVIRWTVGDGTAPERNFERFPFYDEFTDAGLLLPDPPSNFTAFNSSILVHLQMIYPPPIAPGVPASPPSAAGQSAPMVIASGFEARIMEAEVMYRGGNTAGAEGTINALLTTGDNPHGAVFAPVDLTGDFDSDIALIGYAYEAGAWLTGHRMGFVRRVLRNDGVDLFPPTQPGSDTAFPVVKQELDNNPDINQACPSGPPWS